MKKLVNIGLIAVIVAAVAGGILIWKAAFSEKILVSYTTVKADKGDMTNSISATGTVEPEELVNVGAQIGGMITVFGKDTKGNTVDYGSEVKAGQMLALIDDSLYKADLQSAEADKLKAEAAIASAKANILQSDAKYDLAKSDWDRAQKLYPQGIVAKSAYDSTNAEYLSASAEKAVDHAALSQAEAQKASAEAQLAKCRRNLEYCVINSPVDGVIIDRRVSIGQTVVASMNAPSLFLIAKDLKKMQIWVSVNEADIGQIKVGQKVVFTADAFPGRKFEGSVVKIRLNATMSQNVVTYIVEIGTDNSDGTLLPYLTASVKFILDERKDVLRVPNAALRYTPQDAVAPKTGKDEKVVWCLENGSPVPHVIKTGLNDGSHTEVLEGLSEGADVITGSREVSASDKAVQAANADGKDGEAESSPFVPKPPQHGSKK